MSQNGNELAQGQQQQAPSLCANGCGFFANTGTGGMCSKCYRETVSEAEKGKAAEAVLSQAAAAAPKSVTAAMPASIPVNQPMVEMPLPQPSSISSPIAMPAPVSAAAAAAPTPGPSGPVEPAAETAAASDSARQGPSRCLQCRKKVGLTGFKCKCGGMFCGQHRYAESHSCQYDYKAVQRQKLAENNPLVQASKVERI